MKSTLHQFLTSLAGLFRPISKAAEAGPSPITPIGAPAEDDIQFCNHPRHGASPVRRTFKANGVSAHGYSFKVFQCPAAGCGQFVARTINPATGQERILFRGKFYNPRREALQRPAYRPIRTATRAT